MALQQLIPVLGLRSGGCGVVRQLTGQHGAISRLSALGFTLGADVWMVRNPRHGPVVVAVRNTRVALAREVAGGIIVQERQSEGM